MMKSSMNLFKAAVFCLICAIIFALVANIINVKPVLMLTSIAVFGTIVCTVMWICSLMYNKFKYSKNVITTIFFAAVAVTIYLLNPQVFMIESFSGFQELSVVSTIFVAAAMISAVSLLVLIARMMFPKGK